MANQARKLQAKNGNGAEVSIHTQETDSPILPVAQLEQLHQFRPDLVDFVVEQTKAEAEHRRKQSNRINTFVFVEHLLGIVASFAIGLVGVAGGIYAGLHGQPVLGGTIVTVCLGTLAVAFLRGRPRK